MNNIGSHQKKNHSQGATSPSHHSKQARKSSTNPRSKSTNESRLVDETSSHSSNTPVLSGWKCAKCSCPEHLTPVKRLGPDGQRNICNACYIRGRAMKERGMRGSARPTVLNSSVMNGQNQYHVPQQKILVSPTSTLMSFQPQHVMFTPGGSSPTRSSFGNSQQQQQQLMFYQSMISGSGSSSPTAASSITAGLPYFDALFLQQQQIQQQQRAYNYGVADLIKMNDMFAREDPNMTWANNGPLPAKSSQSKQRRDMGAGI